MTSKTPYQRIMRAADRGTGCCLAAEECKALSDDHAIYCRADLDDEEEKEENERTRNRKNPLDLLIGVVKPRKASTCSGMHRNGSSIRVGISATLLELQTTRSYG